MREKHTKGHSVFWTPTDHEKIKKAAALFEVSFGEIVRECVARELPRLIVRESKRKQAQQNKD